MECNHVSRYDTSNSLTTAADVRPGGLRDDGLVGVRNVVAAAVTSTDSMRECTNPDAAIRKASRGRAITTPVRRVSAAVVYMPWKVNDLQ